MTAFWYIGAACIAVAALLVVWNDVQQESVNRAANDFADKFRRQKPAADYVDPKRNADGV